MESALNTGDTAWVLTAAAMVLLMIPGLAFFYGGMARSKSVLNVLMMVMGALFVVGVLWVLFGYSIAFGTSNSGLFGNPAEAFGLEGLMADDPESTLPVMAFVGFQAMFACLTVGLIAGAVPDRMKFGAWLVFGAIWAVIVYFPVAHWVWAPGGWIFELGVIDFAGGTAVHINAGAAALALALIVGRRRGWPKTPMRPHNLTLVMLGAGLLWFGWFGFNAGSALAANGIAATALMNTFLAASAGMIGWLVFERIKDGKATTLGAASGAVAGLVAITPCAGFVGGMSPIVIGFIAGFLCVLAVQLKFKLGYDDSLDVVGVHLVGGLVGALLLGFFADASINELVTHEGVFLGGGFSLLWFQFVASIATFAFSFVVSLILAKVIDLVIGLRVSEEEELEGLDISQHAESAYSFGSFGSMDRV